MPISIDSSINSTTSSNGPDPRVIEALKEYESSREFQASVHKVETGAMSSSRRSRNSTDGGPDPHVMESLRRLDSTREMRGSLTSQQDIMRSSCASSNGGSSMSSMVMSDDEWEEEDKTVSRMLKLEKKMDDLDQQIFRTQEMVRVRLNATNNDMAAVISMKHCLKLEAQREQVLRKLKQTTTTDLPGSEFSNGVEDEEEQHNYRDYRTYTNEQVLAIAKSQFGGGSKRESELVSTAIVAPSKSNKPPRSSTLSQQAVVRC